jgi:predicted secreted hydrolase
MIILLLFILTTSFSLHAVAQEPFWYQPKDATLNNNAYNQTPYFSLQWWYLDASFNNSYTAHIGLLTIGAHATTGFFLVQIHIYDQGTLLAQRIQLIPLRCFHLSTQEPVISYQGKEVLRSYLDQNNQMCVTVQLSIKDLQVDLLFTGTTKGWIGDTGLGMWGCPLPKAEVTGILTIKGKQIPVQGSGYQEHGWDVRRLHKSWYWGKCSSEHMNLVFSQNMKNRHSEDVFIALVNNQYTNYTSIHRENITFVHVKYTLNHGRFIPIESFLTIHEGLSTVQVRMQVKSIDYKNVLLVHYWRFHVQVTGVISYNNTTEEINEVQMMEIFHRL